jgi:3-isopropylmalate dehydrogenase
MHRIAVIRGDGIGPEVIGEAVKVVRAVAPSLELVDWPHSADRYLATGVALTDDEVSELQSSYSAILLGALGDPRVPGNEHAREILLGLRTRLDLYINFRPARLLDPRLTPLKGYEAGAIDFTIFRENTEGVYLGMGGVYRRGTPEEVAIQEDFNTRRGVERILVAAFEYAREMGLSLVTMADKANAMKHAGGLWRRTFAEVGERYPEIEREAVYVDMLAMDLLRRPERYRVIVTNNLFGDILSDLGAQIVGGLGLAASANLHPGRVSLFEPVHGSAPELAGRDEANPFAAILSATLLLRHIGLIDEAAQVERAVEGAVRDGRTTAELGGALGTAAAGDEIVRRLGVER